MCMTGSARGWCRSELARDHGKSRARTRRPPRSYRLFLKNIAREVFVLGQFSEVAVDVIGIDTDRLLVMLGRQVAGAEGHLFEQALEQGVQASCTDILGLLVDLPGDLGNPLDAVCGELDVQALGVEQ